MRPGYVFPIVSWLTPETAVRRERIVAGLAMALYTGLIVFAGAAHEPWFDEAQAWLIAQGADPWTIVTRLIRYEGTPALWHLLLWSCQRLGVGYGSLWLISGTLACGGAWLLLYKSPFPLWLRVGLIFSYFFCYQYAVVARSYALDVLLLPLLAALFEGRLRRPLIYGAVLGLLASANAHSFVVAAPLALEFAWSVWSARLAGGAVFSKGVAGVAIYTALALFAVFQAWPPIDKNFVFAGDPQITWLRPLILAPEAFIDRANLFGAQTPGLHVYSGGLFLTLWALSPIGILCLRARRIWLFMGMMGGLIFIFTILYANYWHSGVLFLAIIFCLWISWSQIYQLTRSQCLWLKSGLFVLLFYGFAYSGVAWARDLGGPYSGSRAAAQVLKTIRAQHPNARIAAVGFKTLAVIPILGDNIFSNYQPAPGGGYYYRWRKISDVPQYGSPKIWENFLKNRAYDWILLSADTREHDFKASEYQILAHKNGYCLSNTFGGDLLWKARIAEPDAFLLFQLCGDVTH